eukprot:gnl/TRDRNA2_/TRDRNA2_131315_c1_seq1.p1 gnl/TRDRNA2_/TRDRNA2_131315_c1~~gnl/TRDRNA2_/TRDRNA2_131315_c1_seq1.p1  ORF type:complete len:715 (-),score=146.23 gnl/TRDRNA2_/TRDRNA2_131315_c1_seq1:61-1989(-)
MADAAKLGSKVKSLEHNFVEKLDQAAEEALERKKDMLLRAGTKRNLELDKLDPLGVMQDQDGQESKKERPKQTVAEKIEASRKPFRSKKKEAQKVDIFAKYQEEHGSEGGKPPLDIRHMYHSESDLKRWHLAINDQVRHRKLETDVRTRWHEDFGADRQDLCMNHNALFRQRLALEHQKMPKREMIDGMKTVKELQKLIAPEIYAKKNKKGSLVQDLKNDMRFSLGFSQKSEDSQPALVEEAEPTVDMLSSNEYQLDKFIDWLMTRFSTLTEAFKKLDVNGNGTLSKSEFEDTLKSMAYKYDTKMLWKLLEHDKDGKISVGEFQKLTPYFERVKEKRARAAKDQNDSLRDDGPHLEEVFDELAFGDNEKTLPPESGRLQSESQRSVSARDLAASGQQSSSGMDTADLPLLEEKKSNKASPKKFTPFSDPLPQTMSLLLFKNGDRHHTGVPVFVGRHPSTMKELVLRCGESCPPMIRPADALLGPDLLPIRAVEDIKPGGSYILKGQEAIDPPFLFFKHVPSQSPSLRQIRYTALSAPQMSVQPSKTVSTDTSMMTWRSMSSLGDASRTGAPTPQESMAERQRFNRNWEGPQSAALDLLRQRGGLGQMPSHRDWTNFPLAATTSRRSLSEPSFGPFGSSRYTV